MRADIVKAQRNIEALWAEIDQRSTLGWDTDAQYREVMRLTRILRQAR